MLAQNVLETSDAMRVQCTIVFARYIFLTVGIQED